MYAFEFDYYKNEVIELRTKTMPQPRTKAALCEAVDFSYRRCLKPLHVDDKIMA
jgi:hypothetical protein